MDNIIQFVYGSRLSKEVLINIRKEKFTSESSFKLTQLRKYMNEVLLDQIPNLTVMLRSL